MKRLISIVKEDTFIKKKETSTKLDQLYQTGLNYYKANEYENAFIFLSLAAEHEHRIAQYVLGVMYGKGKGVTQDFAKAVAWYRKSALNGHPKAHYNLGVCYRDGIGVPKDWSKALYWFTLAAENGDVDSQYSTAIIYYKGDPQDHKMAYLWFKAAAENDHVMARYALGTLFFHGHGVSRDLKKALMWFERVSDLESSGDAYYHVGLIQEIFSRYEEAITAYIKGSDKGSSEAELHLGRLYETFYQNNTKAVYWYAKSAIHENRYAQICLAQLYKRCGPSRDFKVALEWLEQHREADNTSFSQPLYDLQKLMTSVYNENIFQASCPTIDQLRMNQADTFVKKYNMTNNSDLSDAGSDSA
ncbi:hypothetical protein EDC96DRAFT_512807 [Choanephora cucurbitarum]|nr:hypothetical protein EDC96DRAFT_512807 [Choanephora cucurbitarum]